MITTIPLLPTGTWTVDPAASTVGFSVRHLGIATVKGRFERFSATVVAGDDGTLRVTGEVDAASVESGNDIRDQRLREELFLAAEHPVFTFAARDDDRDELEGELTIRGVARPIELDLESARPTAPGRVRLRASGSISQADFALEWDALREAGRLLVSDRVRIQLDVELVRADG